MSLRVLKHILFWFAFIMLYVITKLLFAPKSSLVFPMPERFFRFLIAELMFFPWKIIPFYILIYYLRPKYFRKGEYLKFGIYSLITITICLFGHRTLVPYVNHITTGEMSDFNVYSIRRLLYTLTDILPAIGLAASVKLLLGNIESQRKEQALVKEKLESELNFLKAQTNPHFLFNTLNNLYGLARKNDANTAPSIMKLSNIMRYILYECSAPKIPIENEVKVVEDYIELERLRYDDQLNVSFNKEIDNWQQEVAPLILLPFIENAFKHGISESRFESFINIDLKLSEKELRFKIRNSQSEEELPSNEGIGLKNIKRQLDLLYDKNYSLNIKSDQSIFEVELFIQLERDVNN